MDSALSLPSEPGSPGDINSRPIPTQPSHGGWGGRLLPRAPGPAFLPCQARCVTRRREAARAPSAGPSGGLGCGHGLPADGPCGQLTARPGPPAPTVQCPSTTRRLRSSFFPSGRNYSWTTGDGSRGLAHPRCVRLQNNRMGPCTGRLNCELRRRLAASTCAPDLRHEIPPRPAVSPPARSPARKPSGLGVGKAGVLFSITANSFTTWPHPPPRPGETGHSPNTHLSSCSRLPSSGPATCVSLAGGPGVLRRPCCEWVTFPNRNPRSRAGDTGGPRAAALGGQEGSGEKSCSPGAVAGQSPRPW